MLQKKLSKLHLFISTMQLSMYLAVGTSKILLIPSVSDKRKLPHLNSRKKAIKHHTSRSA